MTSDPDVHKTIKDGLLIGFNSGIHRQRSKTELKIKCEYRGETRAFCIMKPVNYTNLVNKISDMFGKNLTICYTLRSGELITPISCQSDLNKAIELFDMNKKMKSLRLTLNNDYLKLRNNNNKLEKRYSPPPGSIPSFSNWLHPSSSSTSDGKFIPEGLPSPDYPEESPKNLGGSANNLINKPNNQNLQNYNGPSGTFPRAKNSMNFQPDINSSFNIGSNQTFPRAKPDTSIFSNMRPIYERNVNNDDDSSSSSSMSSPFTAFTEKVTAVKHLINENNISSPQPPTNYKIDIAIGEGGFGKVYKCYDKDTGRELAMKEVKLYNRNETTSKEIQALVMEIKMLNTVQHPRIVQYFGCLEKPDSLCIFMEYMAGGSVRQEIVKHNGLTEKITRRYTRQILEGLIFLHNLNIVHRDIKGGNILKDPSGNVKIADFGASKHTQAIYMSMGLKSATGTPYYMAPEVINSYPYGRRADVWSLGATIVEMLTMYPPNHRYEAMAALFRTATEPPEYTLPENSHIDTIDFIHRCFTMDAKQRPTSSDLIKHKFVQHV